MAKRRPKPEIVEEELAENEQFISKDTVDIMVAAVEEENNNEPTVWVRFGNFEDIEEAEEYALFLEETLPLLLFNTTRLQ
jgi:hypothetical protein